jgi:spectinomycin phosphotransferase
MLEKPNLPDKKLVTCLHEAYGLKITQLTFLPLGADVNTAVYRADEGKTAYFVKLRRAAFDETSVTIPHFLSELGIHQIIAPIATRSLQLWTNVDSFTVILYPFVIGRDGFAAELSDQQWSGLNWARH